MIVTPFAQVGATLPGRGHGPPPAPAWVSRGVPPDPKTLSARRSWPAFARSAAT